MKKKAIVLGCGLVGATMARELSSDPGFDVTVADLSEDNLARLQRRANVRVTPKDLSDPNVIHQTVKEFDVVLGALPSRFGCAALKSIIEARRPYCDISFMAQDAMDFDSLAKQHKVAAIVDCGVSPGMSNLFVGHAAAKLDRIHQADIFVGGLPKERRWPFQYKAPFAPSDVIEEYTRPARLIENGQVVVRPALSEPELMDFPRAGTLEAFNTDGLRSLLTTVSADNMREKTLRFPGHIELMRVFRETGLFDQNPIDVRGVSIRPLDLTARLLFPKWTYEQGEEEFTVLRVIAEGVRKSQKIRLTYDLYDEYDKTSGESSMARTTAFPCTLMARLVAAGRIEQSGVLPLELLASQPQVFDYLIDELRKRGIAINIKEEVLG